MLMGGMILAAPFVAPAVLISDAASDAKSKRMAQEWKTSMAARLAQNDIEAIQECLEECDVAWKYDIDYQERRQLQSDAAKRFVAGDWEQLETSEHQVYMFLARYVLSWQPESSEERARSTLMPDQVKHSYVLFQNPTVRTGLKKLLSYSRYNEIESISYGRAYAITTSVNDTTARTQFNQCPASMHGIMLDDNSPISHTIACSRAYAYRFNERVPEELRLQWDK